MTMPPFTTDPGGLAAATSPASRSSPPSTGSSALSMGTSQDWEVAVEEGATIVRLGTSLYR